MLHLRLLGQIDLRNDAGVEMQSVLAQPKRLALLMYLAAARPRRIHRRDALLAVFWPELPEDRARNALRQALHQLRQSLGAEVVVSRGADAVGVSAEHLRCDAAEFEDALDRGRLAEALAQYGGDLVPGFSIPGASAFDEWLDESRARLRHRAARAAWALAEQHERAGLLDQAALDAHRAAGLTLDDEPALRQLVSLLDRVGDFTGAMRVYEEFTARLRQGLDVEPSAETRQLVAAIRARNRALTEAGVPDEPRTASSAGGPKPSSPARDGARPRERATVRVAAFENLTGDAAFDFVGRLVTTSIVEGLVATRLVEVAAVGRGDESPPTAGDAASGGELVIEGSYHLMDDRWSLSAAMRTTDEGRSIGSVSSVAGSRERPWEAAQALSHRVSGVVAGHLDPRVASWADVVSEPPSFEAHRSHLLGMELHLRGEFRAAIVHFLRAASPESGFTVPLLWAMQASCNLEEYEQAAAVHEQLAAHRSALSPAEQLGCDYFGEWLSGDRGAAFRTLRRVAELVPDSEVLSQLGRDALLFNHPALAVQTLERLDPERGWMPSWTPYWRRLTEAYHLTGDHVRESAAARRGRIQHPEAVSTLLYEARAYAALGDLDAVTRAADEAVALAADRFATAGDVLLVAAQELRAHGHPAAAAAMLARGIEWQRERFAEGAAAVGDRLTLLRMQYDAGQWVAARDTLAAARAELGDGLDVIGFTGTLAIRLGDASAARASLATLRAKTGRFHYGRHLLWAARISAVLGDADSAIAHLRGAFARGCPYGVELHTDVDLALLASDPRFRELLRPKG
jgi:DNA-binding SARP family transcriptional activator